MLVIIRVNEHHPAPQLQGRMQWFISEKLSVEQTAFRLKRVGVGVDNEGRGGFKDGFGDGDADTAGVDYEFRFGDEDENENGVEDGFGYENGVRVEDEDGVGVGDVFGFGVGIKTLLEMGTLEGAPVSALWVQGNCAWKQLNKSLVANWHSKSQSHEM